MARCEIVAELGANHKGSIALALKIMIAARAAGASAFKLQTWAPGKMVLDPTLVIEDGPWAGRNMAELYEQALLPWEEQRGIFTAAADIGMPCFSSVFDLESLEFLEQLNCPRYKIASFELVDLPLIRAVASTKKPIILSTGMAEHYEIEEAIQAARIGGSPHITVLRCTSAYPADGSEAALSTMAYLRRRFDVEVGISDHTPGIGVAVVAAALGASMIEKHVTWRRYDGGLDAAFSIEPMELHQLSLEVDQVERAVGTPRFGPTAHEGPQAKLRRSLYFTRELEAGAIVAPEDIRSARPALGIAPVYYATVVGATLTRAVRQWEPVAWDALKGCGPLAKRR